MIAFGCHNSTNQVNNNYVTVTHFSITNICPSADRLSTTKRGKAQYNRERERERARERESAQSTRKRESTVKQACVRVCGGEEGCTRGMPVIQLLCIVINSPSLPPPP